MTYILIVDDTPVSPSNRSICAQGGQPADSIAEYDAADELAAERRWRSVSLSGQCRQIDMDVVRPFQQVVSHGGESVLLVNIYIYLCLIWQWICLRLVHVFDTL